MELLLGIGTGDTKIRPSRGGASAGFARAAAQFAQSQKLWVDYFSAYCFTVDDSYGPKTEMGRECDLVVQSQRISFLTWAHPSVVAASGGAKGAAQPQNDIAVIERLPESARAALQGPGSGPRSGSRRGGDCLGARSKKEGASLHRKSRPGGSLDQEYRKSIRRWRAYRQAACASATLIGHGSPTPQACQDVQSRQPVLMLGWLP